MIESAVIRICLLEENCLLKGFQRSVPKPATTWGCGIDC